MRGTAFSLGRSGVLVLGVALTTIGCGDESTAGVGGTGAGGAGGSGASGGSGGSTGGAEFVMAPHPAFPVIDGDPAAIIAKPKLVTITFSDDANTEQLQAVGDAIGTSDWLKAVGTDYGVTEGTHLAKVVLPEPAPLQATDPEVLDLVDQYIQSGLVPAPAADIMYMIYVPAQTDLDDGWGYHVCTDYLGYHYQAQVSSGLMTYAFVGDCGGGLEEITATFAHEYIETATDPDVENGYYLRLKPSDTWYVLDGLENADLCDYADYVTEGGFTYQRVWSNKAAAEAVTSPCAPIDPNETFFNVYSDPATIPSLAVGESATFTLTGWSAGPVDDWKLDYDGAYFGEFEPEVEFSGLTMNNGQSVTIKLTVPAGTPKGRLGTAMVYSGPGYGRFWPVTVRSK
ncbi:MAG: hypothetical protein IPK82_19890 [Polyangiaceae bacterium]|nr:hypothetical protein [Polyangiaceae bacterium]